MKWVSLVLIGLLPAVAPANLVISEVLFNEVGSDVSGEWIEIYNNGTEAVDLTGWRIGDEEARAGTSLTEAMLVFPGGATIAPGVVQVMALNAIRFNALYGFLPTYEAASGSAGDDPAVPNLTNDPVWDPDGGIINMSNANDHVLLVDAADGIVDRMNWGNNGGLSPGLNPDAEADGQSWQRIDPRTDTDRPEDWELAPADVRSTPGKIPGPLLFQAELFEGPSGPTLRWTPKSGATTYRVQMSEGLEEWSDEALELTTTEWVLPLTLPARVFFRVLAD